MERGKKMNSMQGAIKYKLRDPMTTEDLYTLMTQRWSADLPCAFQLKKGLFGTYIRFETYMTIQPIVKVKDNVVKISRNIVQTQINGIDLRSATQAIDVMRNGGNMMNVMLGGPEYFLKVCAEVQNIIQDRIVS